jgi:hypothetical protein
MRHETFRGVVFSLYHSEKAGGVPIPLDMKFVNLGADTAHGRDPR